MNTEPNIINYVVAPSELPLFLQISPGNWLERPTPGVFSIEGDLTFSATGSLLVEKGNPGELKVASPDTSKIVVGVVSFKAAISFKLPDSGAWTEAKEMTGETTVEFRPSNQPTQLVGLPTPGSLAVTSDRVQ